MSRLLLLLALLLPPTAAAQHAVPPPDAQDARALIATLEDPAARDRLIAQLRLLADTAAAEQAASPSVGQQVLAFVAAGMADLGRRLAAAARAAQDLPALAGWVERQLADAQARERLAAIGLALLTALGAGTAAALAVWAAVRRPSRALLAPTPQGPGQRYALALGRLGLAALPLLAFGLAGYVLAPALGVTGGPAAAARLAVSGVLVAGAVMIVMRALLAPRAPQLRPVRLGDAHARYLWRWSTRLILTGAIGITLAELAGLLGLPPAAREGIIDLVGLAVAIMLAMMVLVSRRPVARAIATGADPTGLFGGLRRIVADIWHLIALAYVAVIYVVWALPVPGGFAFLLRATVLTVLIALAARLAWRVAARTLAAGAEAPGWSTDFGRRAQRYRPVISRLVLGAIVVATLLALLEAWGIGGISWLAQGLGQRVTVSLATIAVFAVAALIAWELVGAMIQRRLSRQDAAANARVRTLLPLLRNAFMIVLITITVLLVLSEIGLNIAPLLAGAGVVGLAIGFGAQTLVKDVITGLFNLFENTIAIGDAVEVAGHSGLVEGMTIRTVRLRDVSGAVHTIPFSEVTSVVNMSRDFSYAVFDVPIGFDEEIDRVIALMRELGEEMRQDEGFGHLILAPIEVWGVDRFGENGLIVRGRLKTQVTKQADVAREFNRRLKHRFDAEGIALPVPQLAISLGRDADRLLARTRPAALDPTPPDAGADTGK